MIKAIQAYFRGRQTAPICPTEREVLLEGVRLARRQLNAARGKYDALMQYVVWTPEQDKRIELAYMELRLAEERYAVALMGAKQAGITSTWEEVAG